VLTGRHANRSGAFAPNYSTRPEEITLAALLRAAGYRTGHFGKWHVGAVKRESPVNPARMGFDEYLSHDNFFEMDPPLSRDGAPPVIHRGESSALVADAAADFARRVRAEGRPFFIVLWFGSPHGPYSGLPTDVASYAAVPDEELRRRYAEITAMDRALGDFRRTLRELGAAENTLLWYNSDNGLPGEHKGASFDGGWRGAKGSVFEGGLRVPGLVEWPAVIRTPRRSAVPAVTSDILPTVLDVLGLPASARPLDGISLRRLLVDGTLAARPQPIGFWRYPVQRERVSRWLTEKWPGSATAAEGGRPHWFSGRKLPAGVLYCPSSLVFAARMDDLLEDIAGHELAALLGEEDEHLEFLGCQRHPAAIAGGGLRAAVDQHVAHADGRGDIPLAPPQHGPHSGQELADRERLSEVVVGTEIEGLDAVVFLALRRHHDHGHRITLPQFFEQVRAVEPGQHQVEEDQVESLAVGDLEPRHAVGGLEDMAVLLSQALRDGKPGGLVVLDDQNSRCCHRATISCGGRQAEACHASGVTRGRGGSRGSARRDRAGQRRSSCRRSLAAWPSGARPRPRRRS
jgi:hypothetical protein